MRNKYSMLNDTKVDLDKYKQVYVDDINKDDVKNRCISKLKFNDKKSYSTFLKVATVAIVITFGVITLNDEVQALMLKLGNNIESFLNKDKNELEKYKTQVNKKVSSNGVNISLNEVMFNNDELLLNLNIDLQQYTKNNLDKYEKCIAYPMVFKLTLDGKETYAFSKSVYIIENSDKTVDYLLTTELGNIDLIKNYSKNRKLDLEVEAKDLFLEVMHVEEYQEMITGTSRMALGIISDKNKNMDDTLKNLYNQKRDEINSSNIHGNWEFNTCIDVSKSIIDTEIYEINKSTDIKYKDFIGEITISEVSVSPATVKVKYNIKANDNCNVDLSEVDYFPLINIKNQNGIDLEEINNSGYGDELGNFIYESEYILTSNDSKLRITPGIDFFSKLYFEDSEITIELE